MQYKVLFFLLFFTSFIGISAQTIVTFDTFDYRSVGVYDSWEQSPFRTGKLKGNAQVLPNFLGQREETSGEIFNTTSHILAMQRSRFGSNTFGARIDLNEPLTLTEKPRYLHVLLHTPSVHRVLLIGLGKNKTWKGESAEVEQLWETSLTEIIPNTWCDAIFPISGLSSTEIHSLVIVPDLNSPHAYTEDFVAYIDQIEVSDSNSPRIVRKDYLVNVIPTPQSSATKNNLQRISMTTLGSEEQVLTITEASTGYLNRTDFTFRARAGEHITLSVEDSQKNNEKNVYIDVNNDGKFDGTAQETFNNFSELSLPTTLSPGIYRIRFKTDKVIHTPQGHNITTAHTVSSEGNIIDALLEIYSDQVTVNDNQLNGEILAADGSQLNSYQVLYGQPLTIEMRPAPNFRHEGVKVRSGYQLNGPQYIRGNRQWIETFIPFSQFIDNHSRVTLSGELMRGTVSLEGIMKEVRKTK